MKRIAFFSTIIVLLIIGVVQTAEPYLTRVRNRLIEESTIEDTTIGASTASTGSFTTLATSGNATIGGTLGVTGTMTIDTLTGANAGTLANAVNNRWVFAENSEELEFIFGTNKVELGAGSTGVNTLDFNDIDDLEDVESITFDNGAEIQNDNDGRIEFVEAGESLELIFTANQVQLGAGSTGVDTLDVNGFNVSDIGIATVDTIQDQTTSTIGYFLKSRKVTIGHVGDATADFQWSTAADHVAQNLDLGAVVPAYARVFDVTVICTETMVGQTNMLLTVGNASAGNQFIAQADCDTANAAISAAAGGGAFEAINASASNVWVQGDPDDNTWADQSAGLWTVIVTYVDIGAASSAL